jgi:hypothetical protein
LSHYKSFKKLKLELDSLRWKIGFRVYHRCKWLGNIILGIKVYHPQNIDVPKRIISVPSTAWKGLELLISDIVQKSGIANSRCLEFGVEYGYSTVAFSNYFASVVGVDLFTGDIHAGHNGDIFSTVSSNLSNFTNIKLVKSSFEEYILNNADRYDLIHVDIIHTYEATFKCGLWAANHSNCTLFHDTESFPDVKRALIDIARITGKKIYNYPYCNGLGILY